MVKRGQLDDATQALTKSLAAETLANFDPRVQRVVDEIDSARTRVSSPGPSKPDSGPPPGLSKEYAWEGPPPSDVGGVDAASQTKLAEPQSSLSSASMSSAPIAPAVPEPATAPAVFVPPVFQPPTIVPERPKPAPPKPPVKEKPRTAPPPATQKHAVSPTLASPPVAPAEPRKAAPPAAAAPPVVQPPAFQPATIIPERPTPAPPKAPVKERSKPAAAPVTPPAPPRTEVRPAAQEPVLPPAPPRPPVKPRDVVFTPAPTRPQPAPALAPWKRPAVIAGIAAVMVAAAWFGLHQPSEKAVPAKTAAPTVATHPQPVVNPLEVQQREAMDQADQRRAAWRPERCHGTAAVGGRAQGAAVF